MEEQCAALRWTREEQAAFGATISAARAVSNGHKHVRAAAYYSELLVVLSHPHRDAAIIPARPAGGRRAAATAQEAVAGKQQARSLGSAAV